MNEARASFSRQTRSVIWSISLRGGVCVLGFRQCRWGCLKWLASGADFCGIDHVWSVTRSRGFGIKGKNYETS